MGYAGCLGALDRTSIIYSDDFTINSTIVGYCSLCLEAYISLACPNLQQAKQTNTKS